MTGMTETPPDELARTYRPADFEGTIYERWLAADVFGPDGSGHVPVGTVAETLARLWGGGAAWHAENQSGAPEARLLAIDSTKARHALGWQPRWPVAEALVRTVDWYRAQARAQDMQAVSLAQIEEYADVA